MTNSLNMNCFNLLSPATIVFTSLFFIIIKYFYDKLRKNRRFVEFAATIPGPPALPIVGNAFDFYHGGPNAFNKIMEYTEKYGSIYRLWIGKHLIVGLSDVNDLEDVFRSSKTLGKPAIFRPFYEFLGDGMFTAAVNIWKKTRKLHQPAFVNSVLPKYVPEFNEKIYKGIETMRKLVDGPEFDAWDYLPYISFNIIAKTALDIELDAHDSSVLQFHNCVKIAFETSFLRMFRIWLHLKPVCNFVFGKKIKQTRNKMLKFAEQVVTKKLDQLWKTSEINDENLSDTTVKPFLRAAYQSLSLVESKTVMLDEIITMVTGGTDTVATTNSFFLLAVAANPDIQHKLYDEIYDVFGDDDRPADAADVSKLSYLDQVLRETLRRFPIAPVVFRNVDEDLKIGSRIFPAGTVLLISIGAISFNAEFYPNPMKFNPENFSHEAVSKRHRLSFLTFSAGPRNCIGMNYALLEMKLTLIALLREFTFQTKVKIEDIKMNMGFLATSVDGYKMSIKLRERRPSYLRNSI